MLISAQPSSFDRTMLTARVAGKTAARTGKKRISAEVGRSVEREREKDFWVRRR